MFVKIQYRRFKEPANCWAWYYQLVESYRNSQGKPSHKILIHLGKIVVKDGYSEKFSKKIFIKSLDSKLSKINITPSKKLSIMRKIKMRIPQEKDFSYQEVHYDLQAVKMKYLKYLKKYTLGDLFNKLYSL